MRARSKLSTLLIAVTAVAVACGGAQDEADRTDDEVEAGGAGERYRAVVVPEGLTWEAAKQRAEEDGGHLVTITSAEENEMVYQLIAENAGLWTNVDITVTSEDGEESPIQVTLGPWIGLYQPSGSNEPAGGWTWVTGEPVSYTNWFVQPDGSQQEPNDMGGVEHFGQFFGQGLGQRASAWNDAPNDPAADFAEAGVEFMGEISSPRGYVVEFE